MSGERINLAGYGLQLSLIASSTFPTGIIISAFSDDADSLDAPPVQIGESVMGLNGDKGDYVAAQIIPVTISVFPNTADDDNLRRLLQANSANSGGFPANDEITLTAIYPDGRVATWRGGNMTQGPFTPSVASAGRLKSNTYNFNFLSVLSISGSSSDTLNQVIDLAQDILL